LKGSVQLAKHRKIRNTKTTKKLSLTWPLLTVAVLNTIIPGQWANSLLAQKVNGGFMSRFVSPDEIELIKKWIDQGAKE